MTGILWGSCGGFCIRCKNRTPAHRRSSSRLNTVAPQVQFKQEPTNTNCPHVAIPADEICNGFTLTLLPRRRNSCPGHSHGRESGGVESAPPLAGPMRQQLDGDPASCFLQMSIDSCSAAEIRNRTVIETLIKRIPRRD
jgi:hypothetical protein